MKVIVVLRSWFLLGLLAVAGCNDTSEPSDEGGACGCTLPDAAPVPPWGYQGNVESLACFCNEVRFCPTYDEAVACPTTHGYRRIIVRTYADCGLVAVELGLLGVAPSVYVYQASTKELVGASYATDVDTFTCGSRMIASVRAGTFPMGCTDVATTICAPDGGVQSDASPDGD